VAALPAHLSLHSFDHLYDTATDFSALYDQITERILALGRRPDGVLYAVPGHPLMGETSVRRIMAGAREASLPVRIVEGLSFVEPVVTLLGIDGIAGLQLADATDLASAHHPPLDPDRPALIAQLYGQRLTSQVKLTLMNAYPDEHPVILVRAAGTLSEAASTSALCDLDRGHHVDHLTTLYVPPLRETGSIFTLLDTVARLRAPDGCPWDREQTHRTLRASLLEETYEVLAALDADDSEMLCEELGDLLMQIAMHTQIAAEGGEFRFPDLVGQIDGKLKRRHPHVFGDLRVSGAEEVLRNWETIKVRERGAASKGATQRSRLATVPTILPALARAQEFGDRAARVGFDWPDVDGVLDKLAEELAELRAAGDPRSQAREMGDLLFSLVNAARWLGIDAESALRGACDRFARRFATMERQITARGDEFTDLPLAELDALWENAKDDG
jgi:tetrapyrrole methylase family protein/MazG family protein